MGICFNDVVLFFYYLSNNISIFQFVQLVFSAFSFPMLFPRIEGFHLYKKVGETSSYTGKGMPSLFLFILLTYDEKTVLNKSQYLTSGGDTYGRLIV